MSQFPHPAIESVTLGAPPPGIFESPRPDGSWLYVHSTDSSSLADTAWRANLLATGFQAQAATQGVQPLGGMSIDTPATPAASVVGSYLKIIPAAADMPVVAPADRAAAEVPYLSVEATVVTKSPADFVSRAGALIKTLVGADEGYDAREINVVDESGAPVMTSTFNKNLNQGSVWVRPGLARSPVTFAIPLANAR